MTLHRPVAMQDAGLSAQNVRQLVDLTHGTGVSGSGGALAVTQRGAGANMSVDVAAGQCVVPGPSGSYVCTSDAIENLAIAAAPGVGNSRIDLIVARARDMQAMGTGSTNDWVLEVITGTPGPSPVQPATPTYALALAAVTLTSSTTSITNGIIMNLRRISVAPSEIFYPRTSIVDLADQTATGTPATWGANLTFSDLVPNRPVVITAWLTGAFAPVSAGASAVEMAIQIGSGGAFPSASKSIPGYADSAWTPTPISQVFAAAITPAAGAGLAVRARILKTSGPNAGFVAGQLMATVVPR